MRRELPFCLLVFDWDGTLMDSVESIVECTAATAAELAASGGWRALDKEQIRATVGLGLPETLAALHPGCDDRGYQQFLEVYRRHWVGTFRDRPVLFAGVDETLRGLASCGYLLAVATGKSRRGLRYALDQCGFADLFHATRTADESISKPHPQMLLELCSELGVAPREALMIGDTTFDLDMARNAGAAALAVLSGSHSRAELLASGPLGCLASVRDLPDWLAQAGRPEGGP